MSKTVVSDLTEAQIKKTTVTEEDIKAEHDQALASLDPAQAKAVSRLEETYRMSKFSAGDKDEQLSKLFRGEAHIRTLQNQAAL